MSLSTLEAIMAEPTPAATYAPTDPAYLTFLRTDAADRKAAGAAALVEHIRNATAQAGIAAAMANQVQVTREAFAASTAAFLKPATRADNEWLTIQAWLAIAGAGHTLPNAVNLAAAQVAEFRKLFPLTRPSVTFPT